jgi:hypothetical protein
MAQTDIAGLLTGIGSAPIDPMAGASIAQQQIALAQQSANRLRRGIGSLTGSDTRTTSEKAQQALAGLDISNEADQKKILEIVRRTNPEKVPQLLQLIQQKNEQKRRLSLQESESAERLQLAREQGIRSQEAGARAQVGLDLQRRQIENQEKAADVEAKLAEDTLKQQGLLRQEFIDQANEAGNEQLAKALAKGMDLDQARSILFRAGSKAVVKPATADEEAYYKSLLKTPTFKEELSEVLSSRFGFSYIPDKVETQVFNRTKEITVKEGLTVQEALRKAVLEIAEANKESDDTENKTPLETRNKPDLNKVEEA